MRLKPKVLFLIGGLAVISAVSSQNTANIVVSESPLQVDKTVQQLYAKAQLNRPGDNHKHLFSS